MVARLSYVEIDPVQPQLACLTLLFSPVIKCDMRTLLRDKAVDVFSADYIREASQLSLAENMAKFCCRMSQLFVYLLIGVCAGARVTSSPKVNTVTYDPPYHECLPYDGSVVPDCGKTL